MQELPELDIYRAMLAERYAGAQITAMTIHQSSITMNDQEQLIKDVIGKTIWFVERRAQHLVFHLDNGKRLLIYVSNGSYVYCDSSEETEIRSVSCTLHLGDRRLLFIGLRDGDLSLMTVKELESFMKHYGPDPLDKRLTLTRFVERFTKKRSALKTALMDERIISGIGNVYSDEIAFAARLRPEAKVSSFHSEEWERLYTAMGSVLREAISFGGSGVQPLFDGDCFTGGYAERLQAYNREGEACPRCGGTIRRLAIGNRKAFACSSCQLEKEQ